MELMIKDGDVILFDILDMCVVDGLFYVIQVDGMVCFEYFVKCVLVFDIGVYF